MEGNVFFPISAFLVFDPISYTLCGKKWKMLFPDLGDLLAI